MLAALAAVLLVGCGSGGSQSSTSTAGAADDHNVTRTLTRRQFQAALCGELKARLEGIEHIATMDDPQPGALKGRLPVTRTERASTEAIHVSHEFVPVLRRGQAPAGARQAVRSAEQGYRRLRHKLRGRPGGDAQDGLRIELSFLKIAAAEIRGCMPSA
jgi:hypothetical protein